MVVFNYTGKEVSAKIVYYGPGLSGKTTNLEWIYGKVPETQRGKMVSMKTKTDRTLFFDFLPLSAGEINGFKSRFLLYTVPGQVYYNATRKLVLKGADGIVFVADSDPELREANKESFDNLQKNLAEYGTSLDSVPIVLQYNKRDVANAMSVEQLNADLNPKGWPVMTATAVRGEGVFETFKEITRIVFQRMNERLDRKSTPRPGVPSTGAAASAPAEVALSAPAAAPPAPARSPELAPVIHLSSIEQVLGGSGGRAGAGSAPGMGGSHAPSEAAGRPQSSWGAASRGLAPSAPGPAAASAPRIREEDPIVEHQVRVPITLATVRPGRIRLVIDIDLREERPGS